MRGHRGGGVWEEMLSLTSVTHHSYGGRGEEQNSLFEQGQSPQGEHVHTKELKEICEAPDWMMNQLQEQSHDGHNY